jgi:hypothetical protein
MLYLVADLHLGFYAFDYVLFEFGLGLFVALFSCDLVEGIGTCLSNSTLEMILQATCCEGLFLSQAV